MSSLPLEGKVALVTGAAKRTGRTIALALAEAGADLVIHYYASATEAEEVVAEVERRGRRAMALSADLGDAAATETAFQQAAHTMGGLHILVNNACGILWKRLDATTSAEWHWAVEQTLHITFHACQAALPTMRQQGFGRIVNLIDVDADSLRAVPGLTPYKIGKTGVLMLTRTLAVTEAPHGITVNGVSPAPWTTPSANRPSIASPPAALAPPRMWPGRCCFWPTRPAATSPAPTSR
jgi:3-oxoacyl-[acyl-carrier protein] reductase